ncbi:glycosyltransferase family A protein [cf. Phormidesmis sp. LEGE 11477]|uniref:glycosyltransferase family A protein n=1 Tax=cf. Phormidesmis sp. LEGE 11477 TaxID=1828680 RepID=UPI00187EF5AA|nr:glycosyltransferase family A protein [cf. Phormidesmis sp. LEGE 11477]MBE9060365.1 glycosyltransferase family 2 protein [cf. Phormidesmis sp. LEGE 11477]
MQKAIVSVIIPAYNNGCYLAEAIDSVLAQDYQPFEIIVVDDGSTDQTAAIAQRYGPAVTYVFQENSGTSVARNRGVELAKGNMLAFLDADDYWASDKLSQQVAVLSSHLELEAVFGLVEQFRSAELTEIEQRQISCPPSPMAGYLPSAMLITKAAFSRIGLFDPSKRMSEFVDWYAHATEAKLRSHMLPTLVAYRRLHLGNKGRKTKSNTQLTRLLKASIDRRRAATRA